MNYIELLQQILEVCVIPLLGVLTVYAVNYIKAKSNEITNKTENDLIDKYVEIAANTITSCVIATNQTYVEALKKQNSFTPEAQKEAFNKTLNAVKLILSEDAKTVLTAAFGDLETYLTSQIEATVNGNKVVV